MLVAPYWVNSRDGMLPLLVTLTGVVACWYLLGKITARDDRVPD